MSMRIIAIYDNQGETLDRYTFVFNEKQDNMYVMLGTDETGQAFSNFTLGHYDTVKNNKHLGKEVAWYTLQPELLKHVIGRIS